MPDDEIGVLRDALSTHQAVLLGALHGNDDLDIDRAFQVHVGLSKILAHWDEFTANQQRAVVATVEYVVNTDDDINDLTSRNGFLDDLDRLRELEHQLGYL